MKRLDAKTGLLVAALIAVAAATIWAFLSPGPSSRTAADVAAGRAEAFVVGQPVSFAQGGFWLVHLADGAFLALSWKDPNDGCTVPWRPTFEFLDSRGWFRNPCHAQTYDLEGACRFGKCDRGLDRFAVRIERGVVLVDTSTTTPGPARRPTDCEPSYPTVCLPPPRFSFTCSPLYAGMIVLPPDPLRLDPDGDGKGCD